MSRTGSNPFSCAWVYTLAPVLDGCAPHVLYLARREETSGSWLCCDNYDKAAPLFPILEPKPIHDPDHRDPGRLRRVGNPLSIFFHICRRRATDGDPALRPGS